MFVYEITTGGYSGISMYYKLLFEKQLTKPQFSTKVHTAIINSLENLVKNPALIRIVVLPGGPRLNGMDFNFTDELKKLEFSFETSRGHICTNIHLQYTDDPIFSSYFAKGKDGKELLKVIPDDLKQKILEIYNQKIEETSTKRNIEEPRQRKSRAEIAAITRGRL